MLWIGEKETQGRVLEIKDKQVSFITATEKVPSGSEQMVYALMTFCSEKLKLQELYGQPVEFSRQEKLQLEYQLQTEIESVIRIFDDDKDAEIYLHKNQYSLEINQKEFFGIIEPFLRGIENLVNNLKQKVQPLEDADKQIDTVYIVGSSSRNEEIQRRIREQLGPDVNLVCEDDPDTAIALGTAEIAHFFS